MKSGTQPITCHYFVIAVFLKRGEMKVEGKDEYERVNPEWIDRRDEMREIYKKRGLVRERERTLIVAPSTSKKSLRLPFWLMSSLGSIFEKSAAKSKEADGTPSSYLGSVQLTSFSTFRSSSTSCLASVSSPSKNEEEEEEAEEEEVDACSKRN
jgi:hypothetical protein